MGELPGSGAGGETQLRFVEPARRRLATRVAEFTNGSTWRTVGRRERDGGSDCSVNFILPQLRGRQGERTSLAPRPRRPTFLPVSGENETADRERAIR